MKQQNLALSSLLIGGSIFLASFGEFISQHQDWHTMTTPSEVGHMMLLAGSAVATLAGALGLNVNLPGKKDGQ